MAFRQTKTPKKVDLELGKDFGVKSRVYIGAATACLLVFALGGWAAKAELTGAVLAPGQIKVEKDLRAVQHLDGGIIKEIAVRKGDEIKADQLLFRLDDTQTLAELQIVRTQMVELLSKRSRLMAERDGSKNMPSVTDPLQLGVMQSDVLKGEINLFKGNRKSRESQKEQLALSINQLEEEVNGLKSQSGANKSELALVQEELNKVKDLKKKGLIEDSRVLTSTRDMTRLKGEKGNIEAGLAKAAARKSELEVGMIEIDQAARTEAQKQLSDVEPRITELEQRHAAIKDRLSRMEIRSPMGGIVNDISVNTIGGVITPAQKLLTIVPEDSKLQIEVRLSPGDIDQIFFGQHAKLRFSAFQARTTPELDGKITFLSPATTTEEGTGEVYYTAQLELLPGEIEKLEGKKLIPGMPVEAFVQTESRTALSYLIKPFVDQFARAFRES